MAGKILFWEMTVLEIEFREMKEEYLDEVLAIYNHYVETSTATFHEKLQTKEEMRGIVFFRNPKYRTYAIFSGETLCGYVLLTRYKARSAYDCTAEVTIYLRPECAGKGIGRQALAFIEVFGKKQGFHSLVSVITGENTASIGLFSACGYEKCAHYKEVGRKFGRYLDVVCCQKRL